jgi:hypothetical protein
MSANPASVLKKNQVRQAGEPPPAAAAAPRPSAGLAQARIIEMAPDSAIIEVKCACGRFTYVRCTWPPAADIGAAGRPTPKQ